MVRDQKMESRRDKSASPWWVLMSFLLGAITLCAAGVVIVDGWNEDKLAAETTFYGKIQRLPIPTTLGVTAGITGIAISVFAHLNICIFAFGRSAIQGLACFFLPVIYSVIYGIMNWTDNKAPVKAIMWALLFIGVGVGFIMWGGGFGKIQALF